MKHVAEENQRVIQSLKANSKELGDLINQSHKSLQQLGVSLPAIDEKVRELQQIDGVLGARMMGGGFGGMILVLVEDDHVLPEAIPVISSGPASYRRISLIFPIVQVYPCPKMVFHQYVRVFFLTIVDTRFLPTPNFRFTERHKH